MGYLFRYKRCLLSPHRQKLIKCQRNNMCEFLMVDSVSELFAMKNESEFNQLAK